MKRLKLLSNQKAMTLVELLVTLALVVVVTTLLTAFLKEGFLSYDRTVSEADLQLSLRHRTEVIINDIRNSKVAEIEGISYPLANPDSQQLTLFTGTLADNQTITYSLIGSTLYRQEGSDDKEVLISNVQNFTVSSNEESLVTIDVLINSKTEHYQDEMEKEIVLQAKPRTTLPALTN